MDKIDTIKKELTALFDEMLDHRTEFRRKLYPGVMEKARGKYAGMTDDMIQCIEQAPEDEKKALIEELAQVIPDYAYEKMQSGKKRTRDRDSVDYNLNMVVYVVPILNYSGRKECISLTERMVELWNEKGVTDMRLSHSTYEEICGGFNRRFCYITTAVCESLGKPDDCYELQAFRNFRDSYLLRSEKGQNLVEEYYDIAPGIVMLINMRDNAEEIYSGIYTEYLNPCLGFIERGENEACQKHYVSMMHRLQEKYLYA